MIKVREVKIVKGVIAGDIKRTRTKSTLLYKALKWKVTLNKSLLHLKEMSGSGNKSTDNIKEIVILSIQCFLEKLIGVIWIN